MTLTKHQLKRIMDNPAVTFPAGHNINYASRVAENYARKKIYRWEDKAALEIHKLLKGAYADIRSYAYYAAEQNRISTIANDAGSIVFRRMVTRHLTDRIAQFANDAGKLAYQYAVVGLAAGWYLRQWQIHQGLHKTPDFKPEKLSPRAASAKVLQPYLNEAVRADTGLYDYAGNEWREKYTNVGTAGILRARGALNRTVTQPASVSETVNAIGETIGTDNQNPKGLYHNAQVTARTDVLRGFTWGSAAAYERHTEWITAILWVTSNDDRVCRICRPYHGRIIPVDSLLGSALYGLPPDGTHYGCRCSIFPLLIPIIADREVPPEDNFDEWLDEWQFSDELDWFMDDMQLESTMI